MFRKIILIVFLSMLVNFVKADEGFLLNKEPLKNIESQVVDVRTGDLNNDGKNDIAILTGKYENSDQKLDYKLIIYFQELDGSFLEDNKVEFNAPFTKNFIITDANNDSLNDIVFPYANGIKFLFQSNDGSFSYFNLNDNSNDIIRSGDLNNDGLEDFVSVNSELDSYNINIFIQGSNFTFEKSVYSLLRTVQFQIVDLDNDDFDELIMLNMNKVGGEFAIVSFNSNGLKEDVKYLDFNINGTIKAFYTEDIDGDNLKDLLFTYIDEDNKSYLKILKQDSNGDFNDYDIIDLDFDVDSLIVADFNNDKQNDIVIKNSLLGNLNLFIQNSDNSFREEEYSFSESYRVINNIMSLNDINSDSTLDLVLPVISEVKAPNNGFITFNTINNNIIIPHIATEEVWNTYLVFDNIDDNLSRSIVTIFNEDGSSVTEEVFVYPGETYKMKLEEGICGKISIRQGNPIIKEVFENVESNGQGIAEFYLNNETSKNLVYLFPQYASDSLTWNGIVITNAESSDANVEMNVIDKSGNLMAAVSLQIEGNSRKSGLIEDFVNNIDKTKIAKIIVTSDTPLSGLIISGFNNEKLLFTKAVDIKSDKGDLLLTHIAKESEGWNTKLIFDSVSSKNENVYVDFYSNGNLEKTVALTISANGTFIYDINSISDSYECGFVRNSSNNIFVREGFTNLDEFGGGIAEFILSPNATSRMVTTFPFENSLITWEGLAVFNPLNKSQQILVYGKGKQGVISSTYIDLGAKSKTKFLLTDFFDKLSEEKVREISSIQLISDNKVSALNISGVGTKKLLFGNAEVK